MDLIPDKSRARLTGLSRSETPLSSPNVRALTWTNIMATPSLAAIERELGAATAEALVSRALRHADRLCGDHNDAQTIYDWTVMVVDTYKNRSIGMVLMAIRDGLSSGKVYGKLTYPQVAEWINKHIEEFISRNESAHRQHASLRGR
jgi:hypothetical protein